MSRHKWDGKITKKVRFVTCTACGVIKETSMFGYLYYPADYKQGDNPLFKAGECKPINKQNT